MRSSSLTAGLVSVPTTPTASPVTEARARSMRDAMAPRAFAPDLHLSRLARLRRAIGFAARAHLARACGFRPDIVFMVTATYRPGVEWDPSHCTRWVDALRRWCIRSGYALRYVWVAELQTRGAVHYHMALWLPADAYLPDSDGMGWWPHGTTRTERAKAAVPYLMKYLSKGGAVGSFNLPGGARMYGVGGLEHSLKRAARWLRLPGFVRARSDVHDDWTPAKGGGWCSPDLFVIPSEFERAWLGDRYGLVRVNDYGRPFDASGPFTWLSRRTESA